MVYDNTQNRATLCWHCVYMKNEKHIRISTYFMTHTCNGN